MEIKSGVVQSHTLHLRVHPAIEALQTEILNHPQLMAEMRLEDAAGRVKTFEDSIALVASYVDVTLHGMYGADEIGDMAQMLVRKLVEKRSSLTSLS